MAAGNTTVSAMAQVLKTRYPQKELKRLMYVDSPLMGLMGTDKEFLGNNTRLTVRYGRPQGRSALFPTAQANRSTSNDAGFLLTRAKDYAVGAVDAEAILSGRGNEGSIINVLDQEMKGTVMSFKRSIMFQLYGNGSGARGQISAGSVVSTNTITLATPDDVVFFEVDQWVVVSATNTTASAARSGRVQITSVNRDTGAITVSGAWNAGIAAVAANDYLFTEGDIGIVARGLQAWLPATAPVGGDNFFGVDRSADAVRLAGNRYTAPGGEAKADSIINTIARGIRENAAFDTCFIHPADRSDIFRALQSKGIYNMIPSSSKDVQVSYSGVVFEGGLKNVNVIADPNCPRNRAFLLQMDTWKIYSIDEVPHYIKEDGVEMLRQASADAFEFRLRAFWQVGCDAPGFNAAITFG